MSPAGVPLLIGCPPLPIQYIASYSPFREVRNLRRRRAFAKRNSTATWNDDNNINDNQDKEYDGFKKNIIKSCIKVLADSKRSIMR
jgi:hypothetical protein